MSRHTLHVSGRGPAPHPPLHALRLGGALPEAAQEDQGRPAQHLCHAIPGERRGGFTERRMGPLMGVPNVARQI